MSQRVIVCGRLRALNAWSHSESKSEQGAILSYTIDPKPGDLPMGRLKFLERGMEDRTNKPCNTFG